MVPELQPEIEFFRPNPLLGSHAAEVRGYTKMKKSKPKKWKTKMKKSERTIIQEKFQTGNEKKWKK